MTAPFLDQPLRYAPSAQFARGGSATLPLFELQRSQPVMQPLIHVSKEPWSLSEVEILLPPREVDSQFFRDLLHAAPTAPAGNLPDTLLHCFQGFGRDTTFGRVPVLPEVVTQKASAPRRRYRALFLVDSQPKLRVLLPQSGKHPLPRTFRPHIDIAVVGVPHKRMPASLQFLIHFVQEYVGQ